MLRRERERNQDKFGIERVHGYAELACRQGLPQPGKLAAIECVLVICPARLAR
jgi:hypothetical protein